jgi:hypothetical protein
MSSGPCRVLRLRDQYGRWRAGVSRNSPLAGFKTGGEDDLHGFVGILLRVVPSLHRSRDEFRHHAQKIRRGGVLDSKVSNSTDLRFEVDRPQGIVVNILERDRHHLGGAVDGNMAERRPHHPRQDIQARQSLSARAVCAGGLGRIDQGRRAGNEPWIGADNTAEKQRGRPI